MKKENARSESFDNKRGVTFTSYSTPSKKGEAMGDASTSPDSDATPPTGGNPFLENNFARQVQAALAAARRQRADVDNTVPPDAMSEPDDDPDKVGKEPNRA